MDEISTVIFILIIWLAMEYLRTQGRPSRNLVHINRLAGTQFVNDCMYGHPRNCLDLLRVDRQTYALLCNILKSRGLLCDARMITVEEQVAMFLITLGHDQRNRRTQYDFQHSGQTVSKYFNLVLKAILRITHEYIGRRDVDTPARIRGDPRFFPYFKDCLGAMDGTHIPVYVGRDGQNRWRNRKGFLSQNVLAVVGFDMRFHYILAGWEGSATDARILYSALDDDFHPLEVPHGKYYLADAGYPNIVGLLTPYRRCRYHISEFNASGSRQLQTKEELYNYRHSSLRMTVERVFGLLKGRFPILKNHVSYPISTQVKIVQVVCVIHNFIIYHNPNAEQFPPDDVNDSELNEIINDDTEQTQIHGSNNDLREQITSTMWDDYVARTRR